MFLGVQCINPGVGFAASLSNMPHQWWKWRERQYVKASASSLIKPSSSSSSSFSYSFLYLVWINNQRSYFYIAYHIIFWKGLCRLYYYLLFIFVSFQCIFSWLPRPLIPSNASQNTSFMTPHLLTGPYISVSVSYGVDGWYCNTRAFTTWVFGV